VVARRLSTSRTRAATLIATGGVRVAGRAARASYLAQAGDDVAVDVPPPDGREILPEPIPLNIVYEDAVLLVVDKPAGMVVHPAPGHWSGTLVNALVGRTPDGAHEVGEPAPGADAPPDRAGIVHRLDKETSGLLLVAKTERVHRLLAQAIAARRVHRRYAALIWGHIVSGGVSVDAPIGRDPRDRKRMAIVPSGRTARTDFTRVARFDAFDLLQARLHTGRTHQIRVHLASVGHPVVGDDTYGGGGGRRLVGLPPRRHFLHAAWLTLAHPVTGAPLDLRAPLPEDLRVALGAVAGTGPAGPEILTELGFFAP
jgi:23S rRNA pseudouridine1911/1915/1917 synthase